MSTSIGNLAPLVDAPRRILILDDDGAVRKMMQEFAESVQVEAITVADVEEAVVALKQNHFGLLIVDICLPEKSGLVFVKAVRDSRQHADCPVVVFSGHYPEGDLSKVEGAFENCIAVQKPVSVDILLEVVDTVLPPVEKSPGRNPARSVGFSRIPSFTLKVDHNNLTASLVFSGSMDDEIGDADLLIEKLKENNVVYGIDTGTVYGAFSRSWDKLSPGDEIVVASGQLPVEGDCGRIEYRFDTNVRASYHAEEAAADARVDYRAATHIAIVKEDELLAEIIPPTSGKNGMDLEGKPIPAKGGKAVSITIGDGVRIDDEGRFCYATSSGRPVVVSNTLKVTPVYVVEGDVDLETGNIEFAHHVEIKGDLKDGFSLECESAEINGTVGAATIHCRKGLIVHGGINGRESAAINVEGTLSAKYINQAKVTVLGDIVVEREVVNSRLWSQGHIAAGKIIGGEAVALLGIRTGEAGSEIGVPTHLEPGANFEVRKIKLQIEAVEKELETVLAPAEKFFDDRKRFKSLPDERQKQIVAGLEVFLKLKKQHDSLMVDSQMLQSVVLAEPVKEVVVEKVLHPDVTVKTELCGKDFKTPMTGPMKLIEDISNSTIRCVSEEGG